MNLLLRRLIFTDKTTIGELTIDGIFQCYILEDCARQVKIHRATCIPAGTYKIIVNRSPRFKRDLPRLLDVPGFAGVLIHPGNYPSDTDGCLLPGLTKSENFIGQSREAFDKLFEKIKAAVQIEEVTITIMGGFDVVTVKPFSNIAVIMTNPNITQAIISALINLLAAIFNKFKLRRTNHDG